MKVVSYRPRRPEASTAMPVCTGVVVGTQVLDVSAWMARCEPHATSRAQHQRAGVDAPAGGVLRWLQSGPQAVEALAAHVGRLREQAEARWHALAEVDLYAPVPRPGKIVAVGRNYADHAKETGFVPNESPRIIFKAPSAVSAPGAPVPRPASVSKLDFEGELAVVIGDWARDVSEASALNHVAGYTVLNDLSAREFQFDVSPAQTTFAKSMDGFAPMGPWLVTRDEIADPQQLELSTWLNGERVQHAHTRDMLFPVATLIAYVSRYLTLEPGDVLTTGTPAGIGAFRTPPQYLQAGDHLRFEISDVGVLEHHIA